MFTVVETAVFLRRAGKLLSREEHDELIAFLARHPEAGDLILVAAVVLGRVVDIDEDHVEGGGAAATGTADRRKRPGRARWDLGLPDPSAPGEGPSVRGGRTR